jgi:hypothetical protein
MPFDPLTARNLAAASALGGLAVMMLEPAPNWRAVGLGLLAVLAFAGLSLLAERRPADRSRNPARKPRRIQVEVIVEDRPLPELRLPAPSREPLATHPAVFKGMRARRMDR